MKHLAAALAGLFCCCIVWAEPIAFTARSAGEKEGKPAKVEAPLRWEGRQTALIIVDLWDRHWCAGANGRAAAIAPAINDLARRVRAAGGLVIHAPSDTMKFYENTPARKLAQGAPRAEPPTPHKGWRHLIAEKEGKLPIDDADGGCDCRPQCKSHIAWKRQHGAIEIVEGDAVSDQGPEVYNLLAQRGIRHVIVCGVHLNMCVLGRPFGIRQLVEWKFDVVLVRDLTDTMYNPRRAPFVEHDKGTALMIEHVEKHWCPTVDSAQLLKQEKP